VVYPLNATVNERSNYRIDCMLPILFDIATLVVDPGIFQRGLFHNEVWFSKEAVPQLLLVFKRSGGVTLKMR
jgi:hypothetical protein